LAVIGRYQASSASCPWPLATNHWPLATISKNKRLSASTTTLPRLDGIAIQTIQHFPRRRDFSAKDSRLSNAEPVCCVRCADDFGLRPLNSGFGGKAALARARSKTCRSIRRLP